MSALLTPLDYIAAGYWQDFLAERPIAGGIVYENELRDCMLDESLASLQRVDTLLSQIRRDMIKVGQWQEEALLVDERYRNFMMFLGFYAGRVLAQQWQMTPHWYGQFELRKRYPSLSLTTDDFYQHMAVVCGDNGENDTATSVFFALEPIGLRLFGHIDLPFTAVQGGQVASGLYQAVNAKLPIVNESPVGKIAAQKTVQNVDTDKNTRASVNTAQNPELNTNLHKLLGKPLDNPSDNFLENTTIKAIPVDNDLSKQVVQEAPTLSKTEPLPVDIAPTTNKEIAKPAPSKILPTPEIFTQLLTELNEIEVVQTAENNTYQEACEVLDQFEQHIAKQNKPRAQVAFSEKHLQAKKQALLKLKQAADAGNTAAMLRLAMYELLGEGLNVDKLADNDAGADWVKLAASKDDSRAQRLLSKMYYQGVGVAQDLDNGQYWLAQAAKNGHAEAADLMVHWQKAQALISTQKQESHSIKRYQILLGIVAVVAVLILIIL